MVEIGEESPISGSYFRPVPYAGWPDQDDKPFLRKMIIMRQDFGDTLLPHDLHRNAVGQALTLIRTGLVQGQAVKERLASLRPHTNQRIGQGIFNRLDGVDPQGGAIATVIGQEFV